MLFILSFVCALSFILSTDVLLHTLVILLFTYQSNCNTLFRSSLPSYKSGVLSAHAGWLKNHFIRFDLTFSYFSCSFLSLFESISLLS